MTDDEREALLERMAESAYQASNPLWPWKERGEAVKVIWRSYARAALAVAETTVREDCARVADAKEEEYETAYRAGLKSSQHLQGMSDGASEVAAAIRGDTP